MAEAAARFAAGDRVRVQASTASGHIRTPRYVHGRSGRVVGLQGAFRNPESLAYGGDGLPKRTLYRVRFRQRDLWGRYDGAESDTCDVDLYEHWLDLAGEPE